MERKSLKHVAIFGVLTLGMAFGGALAPALSQRQAADLALHSNVAGGPICVATPCPPPTNN